MEFAKNKAEGMEACGFEDMADAKKAFDDDDLQAAIFMDQGFTDIARDFEARSFETRDFKKAHCHHCVECDSCASRKKSTVATLILCGVVIALTFFAHFTSLPAMGATAAAVYDPKASVAFDLKASDAAHIAHIAHVAARGLEASSTTSVQDVICYVTGRSTYPTPSAASPTETANSVIATGQGSVTPITSLSTTEASSCGAPVTVTVTVTTVASNDALSGTMANGGAPPKSANGTALSTVEVTTTTTKTTRVTASETTTVSSKANPSPTSTASTSSVTGTSTASTLTTTEDTLTATPTFLAEGETTITLASTTMTLHPVIVEEPTSAGISAGISTGTGTAASVGTIHPTGGHTNGSFTSSPPSASTSNHPLATVITSSASSTTGGKNQGSAQGGSRDRDGIKGGYYCIVMAVACGVALLI